MKETRVRHDEQGREKLDDRPMQPPLGYKRAPSLAEQIRQQVIAAKLEELDALQETDEEADDFEIGDDFEPLSPHENDHIPSIKELRKRADEINAEIQRQNLENLKQQLEAQQAEMAAKTKAGAKRPPTKKTPTTPEE